MDIKKAIKQRTDQKLTIREIAAIQGVPKSTIHKALQNPETKADLATYKEYRADVFASKQVEVINQLDTEKLQQASALQLITGLGILYDKERLERGQASAIIDVRAAVFTLDSKLSQLQDMLNQANPSYPQIGEVDQVADITTD